MTFLLAAPGVACNQASVLIFCRRASSTELSRLTEMGAKKSEDDDAAGSVAAAAVTREAGVETGCLVPANALLPAAPPPAGFHGSSKLLIGPGLMHQMAGAFGWRALDPGAG